MNPGAGDAAFWGHIPTWAWPIVIAGIVGFFLYQLVKASETVAITFGKIGKAIHDRAAAPRRVATRLGHIEDVLDRTSDQLDCAMSYLAIDAAYHYDADIILAEKYPGLIKLLPPRISYTEFCRKWSEGWRP